MPLIVTGWGYLLELVIVLVFYCSSGNKRVVIKPNQAKNKMEEDRE